MKNLFLGLILTLGFSGVCMANSFTFVNDSAQPKLEITYKVCTNSNVLPGILCGDPVIVLITDPKLTVPITLPNSPEYSSINILSAKLKDAGDIIINSSDYVGEGSFGIAERFNNPNDNYIFYFDAITIDAVDKVSITQGQY